MRALFLALLAACATENDLDLFDDDPRPPIDDPDTEVDAPDPDTEPEPDTEADTWTDPDPDTHPVACGEPVADAGPDQAVAPLTLITLSGRASSDPTGCTPLRYRWRVVSKPPGSQVFLLFPNNRDIQPWIDIAGTYEFELSVTNSQGIPDPTPDRVTVVAEPSQDFYVQLTWDAACDLDLHVLDGTSGLFDAPWDSCFCNKTASWGAAGSADDGSLDWDSISGYGPETMTVLSPAPGTYDIKVHYYGQDGDSSCASWTCPSTTATVRIYHLGQPLASFTRQLNDQGQVWNVATVSWPSQTITPVDTMTSTSLTSCF